MPSEYNQPIYHIKSVKKIWNVIDSLVEEFVTAGNTIIHKQRIFLSCIISNILRYSSIYVDTVCVIPKNITTYVIFVFISTVVTCTYHLFLRTKSDLMKQEMESNCRTISDFQYEIFSREEHSRNCNDQSARSKLPPLFRLSDWSPLALSVHDATCGVLHNEFVPETSLGNAKSQQ